MSSPQQQPPRQQPPSGLAIVSATVAAATAAASVAESTILAATITALTTALSPVLAYSVLSKLYKKEHEKKALKIALEEAERFPQPNLIALGPAQKAMLETNAYRRAAYIVSATKRVSAAIEDARTAGESEAEAAATAQRNEDRYFNQQAQADQSRVLVGSAVDAQAMANGPELGWYAQDDEKTSPECAAADGKNFYADTPPDIGYPGSVHPHCRCTSGPPHAHADMLAGSAGETIAARNRASRRTLELTRHVRTAAGAKRFGKPIGSVITGSEALEHVDAVTKAVIPKLSHGESSALDYYNSVNGFRGINQRARGGTPRVSFGHDYDKEVITDLDNAFSKVAPTSKPILVHRGLADTSKVFGSEPATGKVVTEKGFLSTTTDRKKADQYAGGSLGTGSAANDASVLSLHVPAGTKALTTEQFKPGSMDDRTMKEVLLQRNVQLKVLSDKKDANGVRQINATVVNGGSPSVLGRQELISHKQLLANRTAMRAKFPPGHPQRLAAERAVRESRKSIKEFETPKVKAPKPAPAEDFTKLSDSELKIIRTSINYKPGFLDGGDQIRLKAVNDELNDRALRQAIQSANAQDAAAKRIAASPPKISVDDIVTGGDFVNPAVNKAIASFSDSSLKIIREAGIKVQVDKKDTFNKKAEKVFGRAYAPGYVGYYDPEIKELHLNGQDVEADQTAAHELMHAIDHEKGEVSLAGGSVNFRKISKKISSQMETYQMNAYYTGADLGTTKERWAELGGEYQRGVPLALGNGPSGVLPKDLATEIRAYFNSIGLKPR